MKNFIIIFVMIVLFGCKNDQKNNQKQENSLDSKQTVERSEEGVSSKLDSYGQLNRNLAKLVEEYSNEYPIENTGEGNYVEQSYYVGFFIVNNDTLVSICRQPFMMHIFPEFAFEKDQIPQEKPIYKGMVENTTLPIFLFDAEEVGQRFYKDASLIKEHPEKYNTGEDKSHATEVPPIYKYKIQGENFKFLAKSKSQWID